MVMYARSDQLEIKCEAAPGASHVRPRRNPADPESDFMPVWGVDCRPCEQGHLRDDPHWSRSRHRIPLTPDEEEEAQQALQDAARIDSQLKLIEARTRANQYRDAVASGELSGLTEDDIAVTTSADVVQAGPEVPAPRASADLGAPYRALTKKELSDLARDRGLPIAGTKAELVDRHAEHDRQAVPR